MATNGLRCTQAHSARLSLWARARALQACAAGFALLAPIGCATQRVIVDGRPMSQEQAAEYQFDQARAAKARGDVADARARYADVAERFEGSKQAPDALAELGALALLDGCGEARTYFEQLLEDYPSSPRRSEAERALAQCEGGGERKSATLARLEESFEGASGPEKQRLAEEAAAVAIADGQFTDAVRWLLKARDAASDPGAKKALEAQAEALIDGQVSFVGIRELLEEGSGDGFPRALLSYKLGRILYHVHDFANAKDTLESALATWPNVPYAAGAKVLLNQLAARARTQPMTVGVLVPLSGKLKGYGDQALQAVKLAAGEYEAVRGTKIQLVVRDSQGEPVEAARAMEEFVFTDGAVAVVGALFRKEAEAAAYKAQELAIPLLTLTAQENITEIGPYIFQAGLTNAAQMDALIHYTMDILGMKSFAILYPRHPYGEQLVDLFWSRVEAKRGTIAGIEAYGANDTTFTTPVKRLVGRYNLSLRGDYRRGVAKCQEMRDAFRRSRCARELEQDLPPQVDFDGLFIPDYPDQLKLIAPALAAEDLIVEQNPRYLARIERTMGRKVRPIRLLGASGWNSSRLPEEAGRYVENAIFTDGFFPGADLKSTAQFVETFRDKFERPANLTDALFFDAVRLLRETLLKERPASREALRQALRQVHDFPGVTGRLSFRQGTETARDVHILTIVDGQIKEAPPPAEKAPTVPATN